MSAPKLVRRSLAALALLAAVASGACSRSAPPRPPNVVLISVDTLRADRINAYGYHDREVTPRIDALAADGVLFENAVAASPWTTPSHMSLLTSLTPSTHGMVAPALDLKQQRERNEVQRLPEYRTTLAEILAAHGYRTAAFTGGVTLDPRVGFDQGFSLYTTSMLKATEASFGEMQEWVRQEPDRPFFLFWHTFEVHFPYLDTRFVSEVLPEPQATAVVRALENLERTYLEKGYSDELLGQVARTLYSLGALTQPVSEALYVGGVGSMDEWLGTLVDSLRDEGLYERTLIVFTSDHGDELGDHDPRLFYNRHGHSMYEEMIRVPLILKLPEQRQAGRRVASVARSIDVLPTVLDVLGLPESDTAQGTSLRPLWERPGLEPGRTALSEAVAWAFEKKAVRAGRYKYIVSIDETTVAEKGRQHVPEEPAFRELYDLETDPFERRNLLEGPADPGLASLASELDVALRGLVAEELGETDRAVVDAETVDKLRGLGYLE